jgi:hypothetical protein
VPTTGDTTVEFEATSAPHHFSRAPTKDNTHLENNQIMQGTFVLTSLLLAGECDGKSFRQQSKITLGSSPSFFFAI